MRLEPLQSGGSIIFGEFVQEDGCKEFWLYLEGLAASDALRDIQMTAIYNKEGKDWGDEIRITVVGIHLK